MFTKEITTHFLVTSKVLKGKERKSHRALLQCEISLRGSCRTKFSISKVLISLKHKCFKFSWLQGPSAALLWKHKGAALLHVHRVLDVLSRDFSLCAFLPGLGVPAPCPSEPHCLWSSKLYVPLGTGCLRNTSSFPSEMQNSWIGQPKTVYHEIPLDSQSAVCPGYRWQGMGVNPWG